MPFLTAAFPYGLLTDTHWTQSRMFSEHLLCALTKITNERYNPSSPLLGEKALREKHKLIGSVTASYPASSIHWLGDLIPWLGKLSDISKSSTASLAKWGPNNTAS